MWRHISAHRATTKYFSNCFVFKTKIEKEGLPRDTTPGLGAGHSTPTSECSSTHAGFLTAVWLSLFTDPDAVPFQPYCPEKSFEEVTA
jgi:hypothetical protein